MRMSRISKDLCLGLGVISLLGVTAPVYAANNVDVTTQSNTKTDGQPQNIHDDVDAGSIPTAPTNGDDKHLNVGWTNIQGRKYYCKDESRVKVSGWQQIDGNWYYFSSTDYEMQTGWINDGGTWYYLTDYSDISGKVDIKHGLGIMKTGWLNDHGTWYFLNSNGSLKQSGWLQVNGTWYYFYSSGAMAVSTTISGYRMGPDGAWMQ